MDTTDTTGSEPSAAADAGDGAADRDSVPNSGVSDVRTPFSPRVRRTGGVLLALSGAANLLLGVGLFGFALLGGFAGVPPLTVATFAAPIAAGGLAGVAGGAAGYAGRYWYGAVAAGVLGLVFAPLPVFIPVELFALVLFALTEDQFH